MYYTVPYQNIYTYPVLLNNIFYNPIISDIYQVITVRY